MATNKTATLAVEIHEDRVSLGVIKIRGRKATVLRTVSDSLAHGEDPVEKTLALANSIGIRKGRLYVVASPEGTDHRMVTLPPMNPLALRRFLSAKLAADLHIPARDLSWAVAGPPGVKIRGTRQTMAVAVREKGLKPWKDLEERGFPVEALTTPEMAIYTVGRELSGQGDTVYIYPAEGVTFLIAAVPSGPIFIRTVNAGARSAGLAHLLQEELRYTTIYLQQHLKKTVNRICVMGSEEIFEAIMPAAGAASGVEVARLGGETLVSGDSTGVFLAAALAVVKDRKAAPDLLRGEAVIRRGMRLAAVTLALAAVMLIAFTSKQFLDTGIQKSRLTREAQDIEQSLSTLRTAMVQDRQSVEEKALSTIREMEGLQSPPWPEVLREISLATPRGIEFDSMTINRGGEKGNRPARGAGRQEVGGAAASGNEGWVLTIQGGISGESYPLVQKTFRRWYETLLTSPYLKKVDIGSINLSVRQESEKEGATGAERRSLAEMRFTVTATVLTQKGVEDVLKSMDKRVSS